MYNVTHIPICLLATLIMPLTSLTSLPEQYRNFAPALLMALDICCKCVQILASLLPLTHKQNMPVHQNTTLHLYGHESQNISVWIRLFFYNNLLPVEFAYISPNLSHPQCAVSIHSSLKARCLSVINCTVRQNVVDLLPQQIHLLTTNMARSRVFFFEVLVTGNHFNISHTLRFITIGYWFWEERVLKYS